MIGGLRQEVRCLLGSAAALPTALGSRAPRLTPLPATRPGTITTPVILVHGYLGTGAGWTPLVRRLHAAGVAHVFSLRYDALAAGVPAAAAALVDAAAAAMASTGNCGVHLVGHSLGGLVARYAVQCLGLDAVTHSVLTVATPHRGTRLAWLGLGPAAAALRPGSALLAGLPPLESTAGVRWAVVEADADVVVPAGGLTGTLRLSAYGHLGVLAAPELGELVRRHLVSAEDDARELLGTA
jgi:pimeloyl-ACP methyl ester carboxylesterase